MIVLSCVEVATLRRAHPPSKDSYRLYEGIKKLKKRPRSDKRAVEPWIDETGDYISQYERKLIDVLLEPDDDLQG
jgi:hypothetical protein